jgi:hypothetical protein
MFRVAVRIGNLGSFEKYSGCSQLYPNRAVFGSGNWVRVNNIVGLSQLYPITAQAHLSCSISLLSQATIPVNVIADTAAGQ